MLPLHAKDKAQTSSGFNVKERLKRIFRLLFSEQKSRNLFFFLLLNLSFAFVELFYGMWTNSLSLISDSFHMFFDCTALLGGLAAAVVTKWRANEKYSYGYVRAEVMAGFCNGLFLCFVSFFIFSEAIERLFEPPEVKHERLFVISVLGFLVNLVGIFAFQHGGSSHGHGGSDHGHSHGSSHGHDHNNHASHGDHGDHSHSHDKPHGHAHGSHDSDHGHSHFQGSGSQIFEGVFLHILADTLGSVGVIISSLLMYYFNWMIADPICSVIIASLVGLSVIPLLRDSLAILMQRQPKALDNALPQCFHRVSQLDGVYGVHEPHFWTVCSDFYTGTIRVEVAPNADARYILSQAHHIFAQIGVKQLYVQIDYAHN